MSSFKYRYRRTLNFFTMKSTVGWDGANRKKGGGYERG